MHKDEIKGAGKQLRGTIKEGIGKATDDKKLQVEGALDKAEGRIQSEAGKLKDKARDALEH